MTNNQQNQQDYSGPSQHRQYPSQPPAERQASQYPHQPGQHAPGTHLPPGQWVYQVAAPQRPRSSGYRVAAGVVAIVLSLWELLFFGNSAYVAARYGFQSFIVPAGVLLILGLGALTTGIVLLAQHRHRGGITPVIVLALAALAILTAAVLLIREIHGPPFLLVTLLLGLPIMIVLGIGLSKEKRGLV